MALQEFSELHTRMQMFLDAVSNGEDFYVSEKLIDEAAEQFKKALKKQFSNDKRQFRLRMSNIGRPSCQLQMEQAEAERERMPYNHVFRMLIGDAVEAITVMVMKASGIKIDNQSEDVTLTVNGNEINGEFDIEINGEIWDVKSASPYMFDHKWSEGWNGVYYGDTFGYVHQLYGYAKAHNKKMGGWIVINKASGEIRVVRAEPTPDQLAFIENSMSETVEVITKNKPFQKKFQEEVELFRGKPTGNLLVPKTCTFCPYMAKCWPDAKLMPKAKSQARTPTPTWYADYKE